MTSIWILLTAMLVAYLFLQQRRQDERAVALAKHLCEQHQVQFLECARIGHRLLKQQGAWRFRTCYQVDFSGDGQSRYQAELQLKGFRLASFDMPAFRQNVHYLH